MKINRKSRKQINTPIRNRKTVYSEMMCRAQKRGHSVDGLPGARQRYLIWYEDEKIQTVGEETPFLRERMRKYQRLKSERKKK